MSSGIFEEIKKHSAKKVNIMEVCGTHTMAIAKSGLRARLPENIKLLSGPGCPVCVTPPEVIDEILSLSLLPDVIIATYGDMMRVPGSARGTSLEKNRALGAKCEIVYSPTDAVELAEKNPDKTVVFLGVGFETTAPGTAAAIADAEEKKLKNFTVLSMLKTVEPALRTLVREPDFNVDAFLCPGHVASIIGEHGFRFLAEELGFPCVIAGFEPEDILRAVNELLIMLEKGEACLKNEYKRAVRCEGNTVAASFIKKYFTPCRDIWRGLGTIEESGLAIREEYAEFDAARRFGINFSEKKNASPCRCGEVICGKIPPQKCPLFGTACIPEDPIGPCMVSGEGACAAAYKYGEVIL